MQKPQTQASKGGFGVQDVLFVLFKHKWKILVSSLLGLGISAWLYVNREPIYKSKAKLLIRYVVETGTVDPYAEMKFTGGGANAAQSAVIGTEFEILNSLDLALEVAEAVGAEKLLDSPAVQSKTALVDAAGTILSGLEVTPGPSGNMLYVTYGNKNRKLSKPTLNKILELYFKKHLEIHRNATAFDEVARQVEEVSGRLKLTESELNKIRTESGILSLADATTTLSAIRAKTNEDLMNAKAEFAEQQANIRELEKALNASNEAAADGNDTLDSKPDNHGKTAKAKGEMPPPQAISEYRAVMEVLAFLQKKDLELRIKFKPGNRLLSLNQQQIGIHDAKRLALVGKYPVLIEETQNVEGDTRNPRRNLINEKARLAAVSAKIEAYEEQLREIGSQIGEQIAIGSKIEEIERRKQMQADDLRTHELKLKSAKLDQTLDPSRMPNITVVEQPSEPIKAYDDTITKLIFGLAGAGLAIGIGFAFLLELVFDRRVKRPIEIQTRLQLPLLLSIPYVRRKERGGLLLANDRGLPRVGMGEDLVFSNSHPEEASMDTPVRRVGHFILPYAETIRDRIIFNFEVNNLTHKPKLVAVTGLSEGAGSSTVAAGLAKSFSEISGMKVLLVDLSSFHPEENPLFGEIPRHSLNGALHLARNSQFRENRQNLYYASATARRDESGLTTFSPVHLYELMPHLQASEYDYIIFDMPPVDQTSRTLTMAGLMDKVLLVLDAENTSRDGLMWGYSELIKGRADVSCVFNKTRSHVPHWLNGAH